jgi:hypothetical protein
MHTCLLAARNPGHNSFDASLQFACMHASHQRHRRTRIAACSMLVAYHPAHSSMHGIFTDGTCHNMYHGQHTHNKYVVHHLMSRASHGCTSQLPCDEACTLLHAASINCMGSTHMQHSSPVVASCLPWSASIPAVHSACTHLLHQLPACLPPTNPLLGWRRCQRIACSPHQYTSPACPAQQRFTHCLSKSYQLH